MNEVAKKSQDNYRQRHRLGGLCLHDSKPVFRSGLCEVHYKEMVDRKAENYRAKRAAEGFPNGKTRCRRCGQPGHNSRRCPNLAYARLPQMFGEARNLGKKYPDAAPEELLEHFMSAIPLDSRAEAFVVLKSLSL